MTFLARMRLLPEGEVTMLFSDIEGSTRLLHEVGELYGEVLADHHRVLRDVWSAHGGVEVHSDGDAFFVSFAEPQAAVEAAVAAQLALTGHTWPHGRDLRVRMGVHTGTAQVRDDDYWGIDVHYAARICSAAHGGQVLVSETTRALVPDAAAVELGHHGLKDFPAPRRVYQLGVPGLSADFPPPRTLEARRSNLPSIPTAIVGREDEIESIRQELEGGRRLVTVTGVGGSGKTRLALACGDALLESFDDGVFLVSLASVADEARVPLAIGHAVGAAVDGVGDPEHALAEYLRGRRLLLILDNLEHLPGAPALVSRLIQAVPGLCVLATSQAPLRVSGELVMPLGSLAISAAIELFAERATASDPTFELTPRNTPAVTELCTRLDGLPLALEIAAARVRVAGADGLLAALERGIDALGTGGRDLPERQRGLRAALDWTVSLLDADARRLFPALGVFAEAWTLEQLEQMFADDVDVWTATSSLLEFSLIRTRGDGRFTMAEAVRAYARDLLEHDGQTDDCSGRHAALLADTAEAIDDEVMLDFTEQVARTVDLMREFAVAIRWSAGHDRALHRRMVAALARPYFFAANLSVLRDDIAGYADDRDDGRVDAVSGRLMAAKSVVAKTWGQSAEAAEAAGRAVARFRATGDERREAMALIQQAHMVVTQLAGDPRSVADARELLDAAAGLEAARSDPRMLDMIQGEMALVFMEAGEVEEAEAILAQIVADPRRTDRSAFNAPSNLAECALIRGRYEEALERFVACARVLGPTQIEDTLTECLSVAQALAGLERDPEAIELLAAVRAAAERDGGIVLPADDDPMLRGLFSSMRSRLAPEEVAALERRGRERSLDETVAWVLSLSPPVPA